MVSAKNMLYRLNHNSNAEEVHHFIEFITLYPGDLRIAVMKDLRNTYGFQRIAMLLRIIFLLKRFLKPIVNCESHMTGRNYESKFR